MDGPLTTALRDGALLYIEEINRIPEETLNVLISVMSEGTLHVPRLGEIEAADGFCLVAAMNPFDAVGTARISSAVYDRVCRLAMGYQVAEEEMMIVAAQARAASAVAGPGFVMQATELVRATREHPDLRMGSSVRGAIDLTMLAAQLRELRGVSVTDPRVTRDAAQMALSGRVKVREGSGRTAEEIIDELWAIFFEPGPGLDEDGDDPIDLDELEPAGKD
jgi:MoxR-like ATPase